MKLTAITTLLVLIASGAAFAGGCNYGHGPKETVAEGPLLPLPGTETSEESADS